MFDRMAASRPSSGSGGASGAGSPRRLALSVTAGLVVLGVVLATVAGVASWRVSQESERAAFERSTVRATDAFESQLERIDMALNAIHGLQSGQIITSDTYRAFVEQLTAGSTLSDRYPGVEAVGFAHERDGVIAFQMVEPSGVSLSFADVRQHPELPAGLWRGAENGSTTLIELTPGLPARFVLAAPLHGQREAADGADGAASRLGWSLIFVDDEVLLAEALRGSALVATISDGDATDASRVADPVARDPRAATGFERTIRSGLADHTFEVSYHPVAGSATWWQRYQHIGLGLAVLAIVWLAAWGFHVQVSGRHRAEVEVRRATSTLRAREQQFRALARSSPIGIFLTDGSGAVRFANRRLAEILDVEDDELLGARLWERLGIDAGGCADLLADLAGDEPRTVTLEPPGTDTRRVIALRAAAVLGKDGEANGYTGTVEDITEQVASHAALAEREAKNRALATRFAHQARHDALTGVPNRLHLTEQLTSTADRPAGSVALLLLDLDGFKLVNDTLGHAAGDELLVDIGERLAACARDDDVLARLGGDEFAFLLRTGEQPRSALALADRLLAAIQRPVTVSGETVTVGASIGVAVTTAETRSPDELLQQADLAMYAAKAAGRGRVELFVPEMGTATHQRHTIERELRSAVDDGGIDVAYQPIVDLTTGAVVAVEALARWNHPALGPISPAEFIPVAEHTGLIEGLGALVRRTAIRDAAGWWRDFGIDLAVNVSAREFAHPAFGDRLRAAAEDGGLPAHALIVELTESQLATNAAAVEDLAELRDRGVRVAIDDFGAGYSSLSRLRALPVDILKIDRTFVAGIAEPGGASFVRAIARLGATLGCQLIAEGIEEPGQVTATAEAGCHLGQGYHFHRPMPADEIAALLAVRSDRPVTVS